MGRVSPCPHRLLSRCCPPASLTGLLAGGGLADTVREAPTSTLTAGPTRGRGEATHLRTFTAVSHRSGGLFTHVLALPDTATLAESLQEAFQGASGPTDQRVTRTEDRKRV